MRFIHGLLLLLQTNLLLAMHLLLVLAQILLVGLRAFLHMLLGQGLLLLGGVVLHVVLAALEWLQLPILPIKPRWKSSPSRGMPDSTGFQQVIAIL